LNYNADGRWLVNSPDGRLSGHQPPRPSIRWTVVDLDEDRSLYRAYDAETGAWQCPPLSRADAIRHCWRAYRWGAIRIQTELGAAILFGPRRLEQVISRQRHDLVRISDS